jgi:flagellar motility protein MotE (MotC chaperone)
MKATLPVLVIAVFVATLGSVLAGGDDAEKKADERGFVEVHPTGTTPPAPAMPAPTGTGGVVSAGCLADPAAVEDLQRRRDELDARDKDLKTRETELKARERALEEELQKIAAVREDIEKIEGARKKESSDKVAKLVETFETMSPKAASALMTTLDESLAVAAMAKISTAKLARIMNSMEPRKSARLSELLAGVVRTRSAIQGTTNQSAKGGEKHDGQTEQHDSNIGERNNLEAKQRAQGQG